MARTLTKENQEIQRTLEGNRFSKIYVSDPRTFAVDKILNVRAITTEIEYRVKFTGYSAKYNEWVAEKDVTFDLKRSFSRERKKKDIKRLKHRLTQDRLKRKGHERELQHEEDIEVDTSFDETRTNPSPGKFSHSLTESEFRVLQPSIPKEISDNRENEENWSLFVAPTGQSAEESMRLVSHQTQTKCDMNPSILQAVESGTIYPSLRDKEERHENETQLLGLNEENWSLFVPPTGQSAEESMRLASDQTQTKCDMNPSILQAVESGTIYPSLRDKEERHENETQLLGLNEDNEESWTLFVTSTDQSAEETMGLVSDKTPTNCDMNPSILQAVESETIYHCLRNKEERHENETQLLGFNEFFEPVFE